MLKNYLTVAWRSLQFSRRVSLLLREGERQYQEDDVFFASSTVFDVFSWRLVAGDPGRALTIPFSIVLTESAARRYFGDENPLGQTLIGDRVWGKSDEGTYTVTGVMEDVPSNSHFTFYVLLSMSTYRQTRPDIFENWGYVDSYTYFLVPEGFDIAALEAKTTTFVRRHVPPDWAYTIAFEPLTDAYLHSQAARQPGTTGSASKLLWPIP